MNIKTGDTLYDLLNEFVSAPVLFVGSGLSFRYLGTETWEELLRRFSEQMDEPFEKYRSKANRNWPLVGTFLAQDYHNYWFTSKEMSRLREEFRDFMDGFASPLKVMIGEYLKSKSEQALDGENLTLELELNTLANAKVDCIITTNYDLLLEYLFPDFRVYKSQNELIFSPLQEIGEIYKIHGCCTKPNSIVITNEDYERYNEKNAYLAAKLMTLFLEHPVIFLGYSISDSNVRQILLSIVTCLDTIQINKLAKRLFFVEYEKGLDEIVIDNLSIELGRIVLPVTRIRADSFLGIYQSLSAINRKYSASLLRRMKEHIYELVATNDPAEKITVIDFDDTTDLNKVEVVLGVGVKPTSKSYEMYTTVDLANDILHDDLGVNLSEICTKTIPFIYRENLWIPVCKYISYMPTDIILDKRIMARASKPLEEFRGGVKPPSKFRAINDLYSSAEEFISQNNAKDVLFYLAYLDVNKISISVLKTFLIGNAYFLNTAQTKSHWMRLVCLLDRLEYGNKIEDVNL